MYNYKLIPDSDFVVTLKLYHEMILCIEPNATYSSTAIAFCDVLKQPGCLPYGLYIDTNLVGLIIGYTQETKFFLDGIIVKPRLQTKQFVNYVESELKQLGYTHWITNVQGKSTAHKIVQHLGAKPITYIKEL